jgi:hypothetical protein
VPATLANQPSLVRSAARARRSLARLLLFWDYDTQWGADRTRNPERAGDWGHLEFENTDRILELQAKFGVRACFAVVGSAALPGARPYHDQAQIRAIHGSGHEVASHSHRHEWLPALNPDELRETLRSSKNALEQCIGARVVTFAPPFNQPYSYPAQLAFSRSERRERGAGRVDLPALCKALRDSGYRFCRVTYFSIASQMILRICGARPHRRGYLEQIADVTCARLNSPCGFGISTLRTLEHSVASGGLLVVYGHPHALKWDNSQHERHLTVFFEEVARLQRCGLLRVCLPRELLTTEQRK